MEEEELREGEGLVYVIRTSLALGFRVLDGRKRGNAVIIVLRGKLRARARAQVQLLQASIVHETYRFFRELCTEFLTTAHAYA